MELDYKKRLPFEQLRITKRKLIIYIEIWDSKPNSLDLDNHRQRIQAGIWAILTAPYSSAAQQYLPQGLTNYINKQLLVDGQNT